MALLNQLFPLNSTEIYEEPGNRTSVVDNGNSISYSVNNINQYTAAGGTNLTYDTRGNLTGDGIWTFSYDHENHLVSASKTGTTASYTYDGLGRRISKTVNGTTTRYFYSGSNLIEERDGSGTVLAKYVYEGGIDRPVKVVKGGGTYCFQQDALGNVVALINTNGQLAEQYTYDIFGAPTIKDGSGNTLSTASTPFLFTGREWDSETSLYHYRSRAYSASLGRFLQADPIDFDGGDPNIYSYVSNNVLNNVDPSGHSIDNTNGKEPVYFIQGNAGISVVRPGGQHEGSQEGFVDPTTGDVWKTPGSEVTGYGQDNIKINSAGCPEGMDKDSFITDDKFRKDRESYGDKPWMDLFKRSDAIKNAIKKRTPASPKPTAPAAPKANHKSP